ncbi:MAG: hypothetical protein PW735_03980 [Acidobacteriaceae bacterium]|nr:hypothetical protein [Acidobacteriaceae bacterium]
MMMTRRLVSLVLLGSVAVSAASAEKARKPKPPRQADAYEMKDTHEQERVTIAAEPGDEKQTAPDTRLNYFEHGMMPIRVIVTNHSDRTLTLEDARIDFIAADNTKVQAATPEDLDRRMFELKQVKPKTIPLPAPLPSIHYHSKPVNTKILADEEDFSFKTTTVKPQQTVAGYLFYDMEGLEQPPLKGATLELRRVRWKEEGAEGAVLQSFEIGLRPSAKNKDTK